MQCTEASDNVSSQLVVSAQILGIGWSRIGLIVILMNRIMVVIGKKFNLDDFLWPILIVIMKGAVRKLLLDVLAVSHTPTPIALQGKVIHSLETVIFCSAVCAQVTKKPSSCSSALEAPHPNVR